MQDYHQLEIWNRAMDYAVGVYEFAATLPTEEKYNLASQLRRAATSAPLNIAEGCGSASNRVRSFSRLCVSFFEGSRNGFGTLSAAVSIDPA